MEQPRYWRQLQRHPLSAEYEDLKGKAWKDFVDNMRANGWIGSGKVVLYEDKVIDGWQRQRASVELETKPEYVELRLPKGMTPEEWVSTVNDYRRHETNEVIHRRADERRLRVAVARAEGQSERAIAEAEGVSQSTVHKDLEIATEQGHSVEPPDGKVVGKDKKKRKASTGKKLKAEANGKPDDEPIPDPKDDNGELWKDKAPKALKAVRVAHNMRDFSKTLASIMREIEDNKDLQYYTYSMQSVLAGLKTLKETLLGSIPAYVCPYCDGTTKTLEGEQAGKTCEVCERQGWVTKAVYRRSEKGQAK